MWDSGVALIVKRLHPTTLKASCRLNPAAARCTQVEKAEATILEAIRGVKGRGKGGLSEEQLAAFEAAVAVLEADGGVQASR